MWIPVEGHLCKEVELTLVIAQYSGRLGLAVLRGLSHELVQRPRAHRGLGLDAVRRGPVQAAAIVPRNKDLVADHVGLHQDVGVGGGQHCQADELLRLGRRNALGRTQVREVLKVLPSKHN